MTMSLMDEVRELVDSSTFSRARLAAILRDMQIKEEDRKERKKSSPPSPVTVYSEIERRTTCLHCDHKWSVIERFKSGAKEETIGITKEGKVMVINASSPAQVDVAVSHCPWCREYIKSMDREELEERYMILLGKISLHGSQPFIKVQHATEREIKL
jgi:transcription elongation factor Elf1